MTQPKKHKQIGLMIRAFAACTAVGWFVSNAAPVAAQGRTDEIAKTGDAAPDGNGTFNGFLTQVLNDSGAVAFHASLAGTSGGSSDNTGIFRGSGGTITQIARKGQVVPDGNGTFVQFQSSSLNDAGAVGFAAILDNTIDFDQDDGGIFRGSSGAITQIAREGQAAPGGGYGQFWKFNGFSFNDSGAAAFHATLAFTSGGSTDNSGIFRGSGGTITQIAREGQAAPDGNGTLSIFNYAPVLNDSGAATFVAGLTGTSGGSNDDSGIFRGSGGTITQIAREGQAAPDGNGTFSTFSSGYVAVNNAGAVGFEGLLTGTSGGSSDDRGIFRGSGGTITQIARKGQAAPDSNGTFNTFSLFGLNDSGAAAFWASLIGTSGGFSDNQAIYIGDGIDLIQVVREGETINGFAISDLDFMPNGINQNGQLAYGADLSNGEKIVRRWTPDLHWRTSVSDSWGNASRWTLGLTPAFVHDTFIDPAANLTVTGPSVDTTVRSLQVGGGSGLATLNLQPGSTLTAINGVTIESNGTLSGNGTIAGDLSVSGDLRPGNSAGLIHVNGDLLLGATSETFIELGGLMPGDFDQLLVTGDLNLAGDLFVNLIGGHTLGYNQEYLIADVGGNLFGQFNGLNEGDLIGNFGGIDLFITYGAGDGNDIAFLSAVPEPGAAGLCLLGLVGMGVIRRRQRRC